MSTLFPDYLKAKAEEEIRHHEDKHSSGPVPKKAQRFHPYTQAGRQHQQDNDRKSGPPAWKQLKRRGKDLTGKSSAYFQQRTKSQKQYK